MPTSWPETVDLITPYVVRISTPRGSGTGFIIYNAENSNICAVATAAHVINHSHYWEELIRIDHVQSGQSLLVRHAQRAIFLDERRDTAAILFDRTDVPFPAEPLSLAPEKKFLKVGNEIGWLGFPAIGPSTLCFFGGKVSAWLDNEEAYLVDGVTINGVSGGPAFHGTDAAPWIMGVVSAYIPNRATGEVLPGVGVVRAVNQFHELAPRFASLAQAKDEEVPPTSPPPPLPAEDQVPDVPTRRAT